MPCHPSMLHFEHSFLDACPFQRLRKVQIFKGLLQWRCMSHADGMNKMKQPLRFIPSCGKIKQRTTSLPIASTSLFFLFYFFVFFKLFPLGQVTPSECKRCGFWRSCMRLGLFGIISFYFIFLISKFYFFEIYFLEQKQKNFFFSVLK